MVLGVTQMNLSIKKLALVAAGFASLVSFSQAMEQTQKITVQDVYDMCTINVNSNDVGSVVFNNTTGYTAIESNYSERTAYGPHFKNHVPVDYIPLTGFPVVQTFDVITNLVRGNAGWTMSIYRGGEYEILKPLSIHDNTTAVLTFLKNDGPNQNFDLQLYKSLRLLSGPLQSWMGYGKMNGTWMLTVTEK